MLKLGRTEGESVIVDGKIKVTLSFKVPLII